MALCGWLRAFAFGLADRLVRAVTRTLEGRLRVLSSRMFFRLIHRPVPDNERSPSFLPRGTIVPCTARTEKWDKTVGAFGGMTLEQAAQELLA
jgi:hypothetical protein